MDMIVFEPKLINAILDALEQRLTLDRVLVNNLCQGLKFLKSIDVVRADANVDWSKAVLTQYMEQVFPDRVSVSNPITCG